MKIHSLFCVLSLIAASMSRTTGRADEVDDYIRVQIDRQHIPGLALAVVKQGEVRKAAGYGLRSTVLDLAKWDAALYSGKILKRDSLEQMWTPMKLNDGSSASYGFGWNISRHRGHRLLSHTGSHMTGFKTALARFVDDQLTVVVFTNQREAEQMAIATGVAAFFIPDLKAKPAER